MLYYKVRGEDTKFIEKDAIIGFRNGFSENVRDFNIISNGRFGKIEKLKDVKINDVNRNEYKSILNEEAKKFITVDEVVPGYHGYNIKVKIITANFEEKVN